ncbi:MAG: methyltransferase domain-containing protein [Christensenellaceae bacterium]|jgi:16S rRNA (cytosine967-C5)-methyltransferase|nr:methyltransferase domain-containing protein [Christensenellaceae bacterium]
MSNWRASYDALSEIIRRGAYVNLILNKLSDEDRSFVTQVVNGTLENYFEIDSIIKATSSKPPQQAIRVLLMQAIYALRYMNEPAYAIVNESVNLTADIGKEALKGYVNAVLKRVSEEKYELPDFDEPRYEEIKYKMPLWLINVIKESYPDNYDEILYVEKRHEVHVRLAQSVRAANFEEKVGNFEKTKTGYYVSITPYIKRLFNTGKLTYQSYTSTLAVDVIGPVKNKEVLDVCAAPGGKSVYLADKGAIVTACDIYPHKIALMKTYADRMNVTLKYFQNDATEFKQDWSKSFDVVLVDAPCSGLGVITKRRDIIFKKSMKDIKELTVTQARMLDVSALYVKRGGILIYSTCTILKMENNEIVSNFLKKHPTYYLDYEEQFLPSSDGTDGFYIAKIIRKA